MTKSAALPAAVRNGGSLLKSSSARNRSHSAVENIVWHWQATSASVRQITTFHDQIIGEHWQTALARATQNVSFLRSRSHLFTPFTGGFSVGLATVFRGFFPF
jgi:uncharacterized protein (DUF885 family)